VTPILAITTAVLTFGLFGTFFSSIPMIGLFGGLIIAILFLAIVADLLVFPAWLRMVNAVLERHNSRTGTKDTQ
jgi:uncharacterized membrane protein